MRPSRRPRSRPCGLTRVATDGREIEGSHCGFRLFRSSDCGVQRAYCADRPQLNSGVRRHQTLMNDRVFTVAHRARPSRVGRAGQCAIGRRAPRYSAPRDFLSRTTRLARTACSSRTQLSLRQSPGWNRQRSHRYGAFTVQGAPTSCWRVEERVFRGRRQRAAFWESRRAPWGRSLDGTLRHPADASLRWRPARSTHSQR